MTLYPCKFFEYFETQKFCENDLFFSTFCLTDKSSKCVAVNLYNLAPGKGVIIGDSVAISEPNFSKIEVQVRDEVSFILTQCENLTIFLDLL